MMNLSLEEYAPYRMLALFVWVVFYSIYLAKAWTQKRLGIQTHQIGKGKETRVHTVETVMGIVTVSIIPVQLLSIVFGWNHLPANARFTGFCVGVIGNLIFLISVLFIDVNFHNLCCYYATFADPAGGTISDSHIRSKISGIPKTGVPLFRTEKGRNNRIKLPGVQMCIILTTY